VGFASDPDLRATVIRLGHGNPLRDRGALAAAMAVLG
jgi:hypothetical protein